MPELNIIGATEDNRYFPYMKAFRAARETFWQAGQDSFSLPPAQNPDSFQQLTNIEPVLQGNLQRRRGYTLFSNTSPTLPFNKGFAFRSEELNLRRIVWTSDSGVVALDEAGNVIVNPVFIPSMNANAVRMTLSRSFGYFSDGNQADLLKWDGTVPTQSTPTGVISPGTAADTGSSWANVNNVKASDGSYATASLSWLAGGSSTDSASYIAVSNFGFSIPSNATITAITVQVQGYYTNVSNTYVRLSANLTKAGNTASGTGYGILALNSESTTTISGFGSGPVDTLWGTTWLPSDINSSGFGVYVNAFAANVTDPGSASLFIDYISLNVSYTTYWKGLSNWGIATAPTAPTFGPYGPTPTGTAADSGSDWTDVTNVEVTDGMYATASLTVAPGEEAVTSLIQCTNFGFSVNANAIISGITVTVNGFTDTANVYQAGSFMDVQLVSAGVAVGLSSLPTAMPIGPPESNTNVPSATNDPLWGTAWTPALVNSSSFGLNLYIAASNNFLSGIPAFSPNFFIDSISITITTQEGSFVVTPGAGSSGSITLLSGRVYSGVFQNSYTGTTSDLFSFTQTTGPLTSQDVVLTGIPVSSDPQVDTVLILATADGGDETTLYLVGSIPNGTTTYTDDTPDALSASYTAGPTLLTNNIYQESDTAGNLYGVAGNDPPPSLLNYPVKNQGRLFGTVGPTLYYSKSLTDVTTSTGTITTKWEEAWPPINAIDISEYAETVSALLSDGQTLYIATDSSIRKLTGNGPLNFSEPQVIFNDTGVLSPEVWRVVFAEGQPVGTMWLAPDNKVMFSDFNTYQDVGTPIQDVLNSINTSVASTVAHACFVSKGPAEYYMLYLPTGNSTVPNVVCVYNMKSKKWFVWVPTDTVTASVFNQSASGTPQWLFATEQGATYYWDSTTVTDRTGNTPVSFATTMVTPWYDFGDMGLTKSFNKAIMTTSDTMLTVGIQGAIKQSDFLSGGIIVQAPTFLTTEVFGDLFVPLVGNPGGYKWFQLTFTSPPDTAVDLLGAFDFEIMPSMRM